MYRTFTNPQIRTSRPPSRPLSRCLPSTCCHTLTSRWSGSVSYPQIHKSNCHPVRLRGAFPRRGCRTSPSLRSGSVSYPQIKKFAHLLFITQGSYRISYCRSKSLNSYSYKGHKYRSNTSQ